MDCSRALMFFLLCVLLHCFIDHLGLNTREGVDGEDNNNDTVDDTETSNNDTVDDTETNNAEDTPYTPPPLEPVSDIQQMKNIFETIQEPKDGEYPKLCDPADNNICFYKVPQSVGDNISLNIEKAVCAENEFSIWNSTENKCDVFFNDNNESSNKTPIETADNLADAECQSTEEDAAKTSCLEEIGPLYKNNTYENGAKYEILKCIKDGGNWVAVRDQGWGGGYFKKGGCVHIEDQ